MTTNQSIERLIAIQSETTKLINEARSLMNSKLLDEIDQRIDISMGEDNDALRISSYKEDLIDLCESLPCL